MKKQTTALINLFLAILEENGYYDNIRKYAKINGIELKDLSIKLYNAWWYDAPDGTSIYFFLDSIEDNLPQIQQALTWDFDIGDMVEYISGKCLWK